MWLKQSQNAETPLVVLVLPKIVAARGIVMNFVITLFTSHITETTNTLQTLFTWKGPIASFDNGKIRSYNDLSKWSSKGKSSEMLGDCPTVTEER